MTIEEIYKKGTAPQLWAALDPSQRSHFLIDHYDMFGTELESDVNKYAQKFSHSSYKDLPKQIKQQVVIHHAMGYYGEGGRAGIASKTKSSIYEANKPGKVGTLEDSIIDSEDKFKREMEKLNAFEKFIAKPFKEKFNSEYRREYSPMYSSDRKNFIDDKNKEFESIYKSEGGRIKNMKTYLTPNKKQLLSKITSIKEKMQKVKDPQVLESINTHIRKLEDILNKKTPTATKIQNWKREKANRLSRK